MLSQSHIEKVKITKLSSLSEHYYCNEFNPHWGSSLGIVNNMLNCNLVKAFKLQSHYYIQFQTNTLGKGINPLYLPQLWIE